MQANDVNLSPGEIKSALSRVLLAIEDSSKSGHTLAQVKQHPSIIGAISLLNKIDPEWNILSEE